MRGRPAITLYCFLTGTAGVPSYCLVRAGPRPLFKNKSKVTAGVHTRHNDFHPAAIVHWFLTRMVGAGMVSDMCCHVRLRTWPTLRAPRAWRGWSTWRTWRMWSTWRIWRTRRAWHAWAPGAPSAPGARGARGTRAAPRQRRAPVVCFGSQRLSIQWRPLAMPRLGCYLCGGRAGGSERYGLRAGG